jgi:hypothetical protein
MSPSPHVRVQGENHNLITMKRALTSYRMCQCLDLGLPNFRTVRNESVWFKTTQSIVFFPSS